MVCPAFNVRYVDITIVGIQVRCSSECSSPCALSLGFLVCCISPLWLSQDHKRVIIGGHTTKPNPVWSQALLEREAGNQLVRDSSSHASDTARLDEVFDHTGYRHGHENRGTQIGEDASAI